MWNLTASNMSFWYMKIYGHKSCIVSGINVLYQESKCIMSFPYNEWCLSICALLPKESAVLLVSTWAKRSRKKKLTLRDSLRTIESSIAQENSFHKYIFGRNGMSINFLVHFYLRAVNICNLYEPECVWRWFRGYHHYNRICFCSGTRFF